MNTSKTINFKLDSDYIELIKLLKLFKDETHVVSYIDIVNGLFVCQSKEQFLFIKHILSLSVKSINGFASFEPVTDDLVQSL